MTFKELKEKLEKLHVPDEAEIQVLTETSVADAVEVINSNLDRFMI